ncbi:MAG: cytochrome oxidase subunit III [Bacteriovoracaceae bacterium]|nr:cytochrome oxidase subunit III [Bacteriovoracaceae bacterium]
MLAPHGRLGMWMFLASEVVVFGGLLASYIFARLRHSSWDEFASQTMTSIGCINTVLLLTSSLFIVLSHHWAERKDIKKSGKYMLWAILLGVLFLVFKGYEYQHEFAKGITPLTNLFWSYYFFITGLHALHIVIGLVINALTLREIRKGQNLQRVEVAGLYWHFVDVVWIFVFPLFYVAS